MIDEGDHYYQNVTSIERSGADGRFENPGGSEVCLLERFAFVFHDFSKSRKQIMVSSKIGHNR